MFLKVSHSRLHGNGCFTTCAVPAGEVVARARILVLPPDETKLILKTRLKDYLFHLKDGIAHDAPYYSALAMGPMSFCNHSNEPNCDYALDEDAAEITLLARRRLEQNEEITIDYGEYAEEII